jgi:hypothetical protein
VAREYTLNRRTSGPTSGIDYRAELNDEQFAAVTASPGPALVIAGAGSGKTRTLTYRVAWLLDQGLLDVATELLFEGGAGAPPAEPSRLRALSQLQTLLSDDGMGQRFLALTATIGQPDPLSPLR